MLQDGGQGARFELPTEPRDARSLRPPGQAGRATKSKDDTSGCTLEAKDFTASPPTSRRPASR